MTKKISDRTPTSRTKSLRKSKTPQRAQPGVETRAPQRGRLGDGLADPYVDRVDPRTLPKTLGGKVSPLTGFIEAGWVTLSKLYGLEPHAGAMKLQMTALGGSEAPDAALSAESRKAMTTKFVGLVGRASAERMVNLLALIVADGGDDGAKKSAREKRIETDVESVRRELVKIKKAPLPEREALLDKLGKSLLGMTDQVVERSRGLTAKDRPEQVKQIENRMRAIYDVARMVLSMPAED